MMKYIKLGKICNIKTGKLDANASSENGIYPFFTCSREPLKISSYSYDCECVLVAGNGELNVKYYNGKFDAYQRTYIIEVLDKIKYSTKFLYLLINSKMEELRNASIGGVIKYIKLGNLTDIDVPIIDIDKQNDIVNNMLSMNKVIRLKKSQIKKFDVLIKSQFVEMFGDPNFNEKKWITRTVNDIGLCVAGATPSTAIKEYWENGTIPWLSSGEVNKGRIYETDTKISQKGYDNASTKLVPPKTVLIAMAGQGKTRGLSAITEIELCTNQSVCSIVNNDKVNPEYLLYFFKMQYLELRNASTSSEGRGGLNLKIIGNYKVMIPPIELQNKFAKIVEQIDKQKFEFEKSLKKLEELQASLMQEYFG